MLAVAVVLAASAPARHVHQQHGARLVEPDDLLKSRETAHSRRETFVSELEKLDEVHVAGRGAASIPGRRPSMPLA